MAQIGYTLHGGGTSPLSWSLEEVTSFQGGLRFYRLYLLCLIVVSVPVKNLAYLVPPLYLLVEFSVGERSALRTLILATFVGLVSSFSLLIDALRGQEVNAPGLFLAMLTYLPLFLFFGAGHERRFDDVLFDRLIRVTAWFVILQSAIGLLQFVISRNGDAVSGTFGLLDFHLNNISIVQVYFTFTIFGMILFLLLEFHRPLAKVAVVAGLVVCAVAQSGHQTVFFGASLVLFSAVQFRRLGLLIRGLALVLFLSLVVAQIYPATFAQTRDWYVKVVGNPRSPKRMVVADSLRILGDPKNALLGTGIGQYSSRAALITSNDYLSRDLPELITGRSDYFTASIGPARRQFGLTGEGSAISKPYFSALSILVELGPLLALALLVGFLLHLGRNVSWMRSPVPQVARVGLVSCVGLVFFLLCCGIENYVEFPQGIFLPFLLYVVAQSRGWQLSRGMPKDSADE